MKLRPSTKCLLALIGVLAVVAVAFAFQVAEGQGPVPSSASPPAGAYDEEEARAIDRMLMCPVCPAETIDQAQVELSRQMQGVVREMLAQGATRQQVLKFFVERYGPGIVAAPPKSGFNLLAYIFPAVGVLAALGALFLVLRSMASHGQAQPALGALPEDDLEPFPAVIDRELARPQPARPGREAGTRQPGGGRRSGDG